MLSLGPGMQNISTRHLDAFYSQAHHVIFSVFMLRWGAMFSNARTWSRENDDLSGTWLMSSSQDLMLIIITV